MKQVTIVADEQLVRDVLHTMLRRKGFKVVDAGPCVKPDLANECDLKCCDNAHVPDLIVLEVIVPRACSGVEVAHKALRRWRGVKILLTSGSPVSMWSAEAQTLLDTLPAESFRFVPKPFTVSQIAEAADELLDEITLSPEKPID